MSPKKTSPNSANPVNIELDRRRLMIVSSMTLVGLSIPSFSKANTFTNSSIYLKPKERSNNKLDNFDQIDSLLKQSHKNLAIHDFTHPVCSTLATKAESRVNIGPAKYRVLGLMTEDQWSEKLRLRDETFSNIYNRPFKVAFKLYRAGIETTYKLPEYVGKEIGELIYDQKLKDDVQKFINDILNFDFDVDDDFNSRNMHELSENVSGKRPRGGRGRRRKNYYSPSFSKPERGRSVAVNYKPNSTTRTTA